MAFTYTDRNLKTVLHSWGRFRVTILEAVQPGDALSWYATDATYTVQLANESDSQRCDCFACQAGDAGDEIWAALAVELKSASTISTGGVVTRVYFAAADDTLGSPVYLSSTDGKPSSSAGSTYAQIIGQLLARDRIMLNVTGSATGPTFSTTITPDTDDGAGLGTASLSWSDLYLASGAIIDWNSDVALTHSTNLLTLAGGNLRMGTTDQIQFRDADVYIRSHVDGRLQIQVDSTSTGAIALNAGSGAGSIALWGYLRLLVTDTAGTTSNQMWIDDSEQALKYVDGLTGVAVTVALLERAQTFSQTQTFADDWKLQFRDTGVYIQSHVDGRIRISADGTTGSDINLNCAGSMGGISLGGYLKLFPTDTDGATTNEGCVWWDASEKVIKYRQDSGTVKTVTAS